MAGMYWLSSRSLHAAAIQGMSPGTRRRRTIPSAASAGSGKASCISSKIPGGLHLEVAVWVALHCDAASFMTDPPTMLFQLEPIRTTVPELLMRWTVQHGSTATSAHSRQQLRPAAHSASWDNGQTPSGAAS